MRRWLVRLALIAIAASVMGQQDSCSTKTDEPADIATDESRRDANGGPVPRPDGRFDITCDYLLGDFTEGTEAGYKFVAGGSVRNTGNIGIVVRVRVRWQQLGTNPILEERTIRLRPGRQKRLNITRLASQNEIDAHQSANADCAAAVKIVDTFGRVRE